MTRDRVLVAVTFTIACLMGLKLLPSSVSAVPIVSETPNATASNATTNSANSEVAEVSTDAELRSKIESYDLSVEALKQICSFLGQPVEPCVTEMVQLGKNDEPISAFTTSKGRLPIDVRTLIITLPDPYETALGEEFDSYYNALQRAAQKAGYLFSQFKIPWNKDFSTGDHHTSVTEDHNLIVSDSEEPEPGVVLFRRPNDNQVKSALLVVFLVGELPTKGIHRMAMRKALASADFLNHSLFFDPRDPRQKAISILGPSFSGSADSMAWTINSWCSDNSMAGLVRAVERSFEEYPQFLLFNLSLDDSFLRDNSLPMTLELLTGSATSIDPDHFDQIINKVPSVHASLHSTLIPDYIALPNLWRVLSDNLHVKLDEVAILKEEGTAYGNLKGIVPAKILSLSFPLHIKEQEELKEQADRLASAQASQSSFPARRPEIPLQEDSTEERDIFPILSKAETNTDELQLEQTLRVISDRHIRYVVIAATDPLDIIYLSQQLHNSTPNTKVIALSNHLLFLHGSVNADLRGLLILSTYPGLGANQIWTRPYNGIKQPEGFASDSTEGTFNAATALLDHQEHPQNTSSDTSESHELLYTTSGERTLLEYGSPFDWWDISSQPTLWLSVLGRDSALPVETIDWRQSTPTEAALLQSPPLLPISLNEQSHRSMLPWHAIVWVFILDTGYAGIALLMILAAQDGGSASVTDLHEYLPLTLFKLFGDCPFVGKPALDSEYDAVLAGRRRWLFNLSIISLVIPLSLGMLLAVAVYDFPSFYLMGFFDPWATTICVWCFLTVVLCGVAVLLSALRVPWIRLGLLGMIVFGVAITAGVSPVLFPLGRVEDSELYSHHHLFALLRSFEFTSGVSPLTPTLYAVSAALILCIGRLLCSQVFVQRPLLKIKQDGFRCLPSLAGEMRLRNQLISKILNPFDGSTARIQLLFLPAFIFVLGFIWCVRQWWEPSIDGRAFDLSFAILATVLYAAIALGLCELISIWMLARSLLRRLYRHPTRQYYALFNKGAGGNAQTRINFFSFGPTTNFLSIALEHAKNLIGLAAKKHSSGQSLGERILGDLRNPVQKEASVRLGLGNFISTHDPATAVSWEDWQNAIKSTWRTESGMLSFGLRLLAPIEPWWGIELKKGAHGVDGGADEAETILDNAGLLVASSVAGLARNVLPHLQILAITSTLSSILMLFASSSYSLFVNANDLLIVNWMVVLSCIATTVGVYASINRDRVLSLISGTQPGEITWNAHFVGQLLLHGMVPLVAILGASFPAKFYQLVTVVTGFIGKG